MGKDSIMSTVLKYYDAASSSWKPFTNDVEQPNNSIVSKEVPTGAINGTNKSYTTSTNYAPGTLQVYINGLAQSQYITETTPASGIFELDTAPLTGDTISVSYLISFPVGSGNADTVDGLHASATAASGNLFPLGTGNRFASSVMNLPEINRQDNTSNSTLTGAKIEIGWGVVTVTTGLSQVIETINFANAFTQKPIVLLTTGGDALTSAGTDYGNGGNIISGNLISKAININLGYFSVHTSNGNNGNWGANGYAWYQWMAIGV